MDSFERRARKANRLCAGFAIAGILPSVWVGMSAAASGEGSAEGIFLAVLAEYFFIFIAYMITSKGHRLWQTCKFCVVSSVAVAASYMGGSNDWVCLFLGLGTLLVAHALVGRLGYLISPGLRFDDRIHLLTIWCGGKDINRVKEDIDRLLTAGFSVLLPKYQNALSKGDKLVSMGTATNASKAQKIYLRLIGELEIVPDLPQEGKECLGRAYLGLGRTQRLLDQDAGASESLAKAEALGVSAKTLEPAAGEYARRGDQSPEAVKAYLAYLEERRGQDVDIEHRAIMAVMESVCRFTEEEIRTLTRSLSRLLAFKPMGVDLTHTEFVPPEKRLNDIWTLNRDVVRADSTIDWAHFYLGIANLFLNELTQALREFEETRRLNPGNYLATYYLGLTRARLGTADEALSLFETVVAQHHENADSQFHTGRLLLLMLPCGRDIFTRVPLDEEDKRRLGTALTSLRKATDLCTDRGEYFFYLGLAYYRSGQFAEAERCSKQAVALEPRRNEFHYLLALAQRELRLNESAIESLQHIIKLGDSYGPAYGLLGQIRFEQGDWAGAEANCRKAAQLDATDNVAVTMLGQALFHLDRYEEAVAELGKVSQPDPNVRYCLARSLMKVGDFEPATAILGRLAEAGFGKDTLYLLGCAHANLGNVSGDSSVLDMAIACFDKAEEGSGPLPDIHLQRANAYLRKGALAEAYTDLQKGLALNPQDAALAYSLGVYYHSVGDDGKADLEFTRATSANPRLTVAYFAQGLIRERRGDLPAAAELYSRALAHDESSEAYLRLGIIDCKLGNHDKAIANLSQARQLGAKEDGLRYFMGWSYYMAGSYELAIGEWSELLRRDGDDGQLTKDIATLHYLHGQQLFSQGDYRGSIEHWETCLNLNSQSKAPFELQKCLPEACFRQALSCLAVDGGADIEEARRLLQKAIDIDGQNPVYQYHLALTDLGRGAAAAAISRLVRLLDSDPANQRYRYHLALGLVAEEKHSEAIPLLQVIVNDGASQSILLATNMLKAECYRAAGEWGDAADSLKAALELEV